MSVEVLELTPEDLAQLQALHREEEQLRVKLEQHRATYSWACRTVLEKVRAERAAKGLPPIPDGSTIELNLATGFLVRTP